MNSTTKKLLSSDKLAGDIPEFNLETMSESTKRYASYIVAWRETGLVDGTEVIDRRIRFRVTWYCTYMRKFVKAVVTLAQGKPEDQSWGWDSSANWEVMDNYTIAHMGIVPLTAIRDKCVALANDMAKNHKRWLENQANDETYALKS